MQQDQDGRPDRPFASVYRNYIDSIMVEYSQYYLCHLDLMAQYGLLSTRIYIVYRV